MPRPAGSHHPPPPTREVVANLPGAASPDRPLPGLSTDNPVQKSASRRTRALILVGHGSHLNADSSAPVYAHAAAIRATGAFDEVHEAFWKEEPPLTSVLDLAQTDDVLILPLFLSEGYFTREVLPREIGLTRSAAHHDGRSFAYLPPVGTHPAMAGMILRRAEAVLGHDPSRRGQATLVVIGHGTERSATSAATVYALVERLRASGDFGAVTCGFLDEAPRIGDVIAEIRTPDVVLVPFFIAEGWHTRETIPAELGLVSDVTRRGDTTLWYTPPVGNLPEMADVILEMTEGYEASADGAFAREGAVGTAGVEAVTRPSVRASREAFFARVRAAASPVQLMDVVVEPLADGHFRLRHRGDLPRDPSSLTPHHDPESALEIGRFRGDGSYRAMRSSADLRAGWVFPSLDEDGLWRALDRLYPAAIHDWFRGITGPGRAAGYRAWSSRQTAMYAEVRKLDFHDVHQVVDTLCASCHRTRCWVNDAGEATVAGQGAAAAGTGQPIDAEARRAAEHASGSLTVPCLEPCTFFATLARERK